MYQQKSFLQTQKDSKKHLGFGVEGARARTNVFSTVNEFVGQWFYRW